MPEQLTVVINLPELPQSQREAAVPNPIFGLNSYGRADLAAAVQQEDLRVGFSRGNSAYNHENGSVAILWPTIEAADGIPSITSVQPETIALGGIGVIRNVAKIIGGGVPEFNRPKVRELTRDRVVLATMFRNLGIGRNFATWSGHDDFQAAVKLANGNKIPVADQEFVITPAQGVIPKAKRAELVHTGGLAKLVASYENGTFANGESWIIQPALDFSPEWSIKGRGEVEQAKIDAANSSNIPRILRAYCFGRDSSGKLVMDYVALLGNDSQWGFVDQVSVPDAVRANTEAVARQLEQDAEVPRMHIAVDHALVIANSGEDVAWQAVNVVGAEPNLVTSKEDKVAASRHAEPLARQLHDVARAGGTQGKVA